MKTKRDQSRRAASTEGRRQLAAAMLHVIEASLAMEKLGVDTLAEDVEDAAVIVANKLSFEQMKIRLAEALYWGKMFTDAIGRSSESWVK